MNFRARLLFAGLILWALNGCELMAGRGGSGTETESAVGYVYHADGSPASGAVIAVRTSDYVKDSLPGENSQPDSAVTDARGRYVLKPGPGSFRIEISDPSGDGAVLDFPLAEHEQLKLPAGTLRPAGSISGRILIDSGVGPAYVQVFGMERLIPADAQGGFKVSLPRGIYHLRFLSPGTTKSSQVQGLKVNEGRDTHLDSAVLLASDAKLSFRDTAGFLEVEGLGAGNPVIFDNERWDRGIDDEYVWARASAGLIDLRGNIVTNGAKDPKKSQFDKQMEFCRGELRLARLAGLSGIPDPVAGSRLVLPGPAREPVENTFPEISAGSDLIVAEARKASPQKPLVVVAGGPPTTVANAYLTDPSIAPNLVVIGIFNFDTNGDDSVATYIVSKKLRCIHWGHGYVWGGTMDTVKASLVPASWMGQRVRDFIRSNQGKNTPLGDLAPVAYLLRKPLWKTALLARVALPLKVSTASPLAFDFLDIPAAANDWTGFQNEFLAALADTGSYRSRPIPGVLQAEAFASTSGMRLIGSTTQARADTVYGFDAVDLKLNGWYEYRVSAPADTALTASFHYRAGSASRLTMGPAGGTPLVDLALPASVGQSWSDASAPIKVAAGKAVWRITATQGGFYLDSISVR